jgi:hypothetical protein
MKIVNIEDRIYKVTNKDFKSLVQKRNEIESKPYYHGSDVDMDDFVRTLEPKFKLVGKIEFDFRL